VRRSNHTRFVAICKKRDCQWVFRTGKSRNWTYWNVKSIDSEHTCGDNGNYNVDFHRVSSHVIGQPFARKFVDPGCNIRPKDIMTDMKDKHGINLTYNKAYRSKDRALHSVFGDPWESFKTLPVYFHKLEKSNPGTKTKIETDRKNRFKYGFMALGACIEGFNTVISHRKRYHMMTTNIAESMNSCLLAIPKFPITSIAEFIRDLLQRWFHDRRSNARETPTFLTNDTDQHIKERVLSSQRCEIHPIDFDRFKVEDQWKEAIDDLEQRSCSCSEWDMDELPCIHAMAVQTLPPHLGSYGSWHENNHMSNGRLAPMQHETDRLESIFDCLRELIANAENTIREERANAGRLTVDNVVLMGKVENLEAEIINLHVQLEARDNKLNGLYSLVEKLQKKMLDFNIPPSP
ncbi:hypothetical protein Dsin_018583, partial [Dipteronia sinensis]